MPIALLGISKSLLKADLFCEVPGFCSIFYGTLKIRTRVKLAKFDEAIHFDGILRSIFECLHADLLFFQYPGTLHPCKIKSKCPVSEKLPSCPPNGTPSHDL